MFSLTIQLPHTERTVTVPQQQMPRTLTDVLRVAGLPLNTRCGHRGLCDGCLIGVVAGHFDGAGGNAAQVGQGTLLRACQLSVPESGAACIHVPARSLLARQPQVVASFQLNVPRAHDPLWQRVRVPADRLGDHQPLSESLLELVRCELDCELPIIWEAELEPLAATADGAVELVVEHRGDHRAVSPSTLAGPAFGLAVDVGTTTVVVALVELESGDVVATASGLNAQTRLGDNVLTRINVCMTQPRFVRRMQQAVVRNTLSPLISDVLRQTHVETSQLTCMVVAGNTTMLHLLLGVDPTSMGTAPFTPVFLDHKRVAATDLGLRPKSGTESLEEDELEEEANSGSESDSHPSLNLIPRATVHLLPGAAAYVGADITAGILASGMAYRDETCMLVDLGTNGEIVLRHEGQFIGCATAAGPAFEGAGLTFGMRAGDGAVSHIWLKDREEPLRIEVIGDGSPIGLCGTAYIDFVARARRQRWISTTARFAEDNVRSLVQHQKHGRAIVVAEPDGSDPLLITEADMACLLQAKAAIAAGTICLLREAGIGPADVQTVYLAGGFGFHMHIDALLGCGMLPGFQSEQVEAVGNTALGGAYLTLLDGGALREIRRICDLMKIVELNLAPDFEMIYIDQLSLP